MTGADPEDASDPLHGEATDDVAADAAPFTVASGAGSTERPGADGEEGGEEGEEEEEPGDRWHVVEVGAGRPVVFVPDVFAPADSFDAVIDDLADDWRCAVVDLPGHGESTPLQAGRPLEEVAAELADVLVELQTAPASFVGHGTGATLVRLLARQRPELVTSMALVCAAPDGDTAVPARLAATEQPDLLEDWLPHLCAARFYNEQPGRAQELRDHLGAVDTDAVAPLLRAVVDAGAAVGTSPPDLDVPVAVIGGADDVLAPPDATRRLAATFGVEAEIVPVAGRMLPVERPSALAAALRRHLDSV